MTGSDAWQWMRQAPAERMSLPAAGVTWGAAAILHAAHVSDISTGAAVVLAAGVTYGVTHRLGFRRKHGADAADQRADTGRKAAAALALAGGWMALAARYGVLAGPHWAMSDAYLLATLAGYRALRNHGPVRDAREWRKAKGEWHGRAAQYGISGSHLLDYERTWLGERMLLDIRETGRKASSWIRGGDLAETVAEAEQLPETRVRVTGGGMAGRIRLSIRYADPWRKPLPHPVLEPVDGLDLPVPCSARHPLQVGYDPENGAALNVSVCTETGARNIAVVGMKGAGKSALLSCLRERLTACEDALVWDINVSKAREDYAWAPACDLTAIGSAERDKALRILLCARYAIEWRSAQQRKTGDFVPSRTRPLIVIIADEIDELARGNDNLAAALRKELAYISSKSRSEGVALVRAGQRGTADWMGGSDSRTQVDTFIIGMVSRLSEVNNAVGAEYAALLPDMARYGEGQPGVWAIGAPGMAPAVGRNFKLTEPEDLDRLATSRAGGGPALEPGLVAHMGEHYASLKGQGQMAHGPAREEQSAAAGAGQGDGPRAPVAVLEETSLENLDWPMDEAALPPDLRARMARLDETTARARKARDDGDAIEAALPDVDPEKLAAATRERWDMGAQETGPLPPEIREQLLAMMPSSGREIARAFEPDITRHTVNIWLNRVRFESAARVVGKGRGALWMTTDQADAAEAAASGDGDGQ